ncbi:hypothetical protein MMC12_003887 [Toensbergia leucococca]|nr:hypothetical protein [Toensbergia leucococca]
MDDHVDSRTASFDLKRSHHDATVIDLDQVESPASTPRKRIKRNGRDNLQDMRDFVPTGGSFSVNAAILDQVQDSPSNLTTASDGMESGQLSTPGVGTVPSINWNAGTKIRFRTSLGGKRTEKQGDSPSIHPLPASPGVPGPSDTKSNPEGKTSVFGGVFVRDDSKAQVVHPPRGPSEPKEPEPLNPTPPENQFMSSLLQLSPEAPSKPKELSEEPESEGEVMINVQSDGHESGEVPDSMMRSSDASEQNAQAALSKQDQGEVTITGTSSQEETKGSLSIRFILDPLESEIEHGSNRSIGAAFQSDYPRTLADLQPEDLKLQLRYFHTTKTPAEIDYTSPVKCLLCAEEGHTPTSCPSQTCRTCGAQNQHTTLLCPQALKCARCHERGHSKEKCTYRLSRLAPSEIACDLCQRKGHTEEDCELLWRTSGRPWETDYSTHRLRLFCYECGKQGHLGNDCPTRNPHKPLGTSTWTLPSRNPSLPTSSKGGKGGGISILGRAQQRNPPPITTLDSSSDDQANFHRPRISAPARTGQIRIASTKTDRYQPKPIRIDRYQPTPTSGPSSQPSPIHIDRYQPVPSRTGPSSQSNHHSGNRNQYSSYQDQAYRRRSRSPEYSSRTDSRSANYDNRSSTNYDNSRSTNYDDYNPNSNNYRPAATHESLPARPRPSRRERMQERYQPMPSAASGAWSKHRS